MVLTDITSGLELSGDDLSLIAALVLIILFYFQYKKYEQELERNEMIDGFLHETGDSAEY